MTTPTHPVPLARLQATFLSTILPRVVAHSRIYFRHLSAERKEEAVAEAVALAWAWHLRLAQRGKNAAEYPSAIAKFSASAASSTYSEGLNRYHAARSSTPKAMIDHATYFDPNSALACSQEVASVHR